MATRRMYRRTRVNDVSVDQIRSLGEQHRKDNAEVGLDIAKEEIVVVVRWESGEFESPWSVKNPLEISLLVERLMILENTCAGLRVGMESTGTYGEAVRQALTKANLPVYRISGKSVSDYKEIFDGVPSQHDGKDAAIIAELTAIEKGTPWPYQTPDETESKMRHQVDRMLAFQAQIKSWNNRLEGKLAKHWPELLQVLKVRNSTLISLLHHYDSPAQLCADPEAKNNLRRWSRGQLCKEKMDAIIESAGNTTGLPMTESDQLWLREIVDEVRSNRKQISRCQAALSTMANNHELLQKYVQSVGAVTLCVILVAVGDPRNYDSSGAFLKALGLNLKELSSGKRKGELAITKRGPSQARSVLYFWAMRGVQHRALRGWYQSFQRVGKSKAGHSEHRKIKGLVALMRKLSRSLWFACKHDLPFQYEKVFPGEPLQKRTRRNRRHTTMDRVDLESMIETVPPS